MRSMLAGLAAALALTTGPVGAAGIVEQHVQFNKGTSGTTISGSLQGDKIIDYKLRASAGQTMTVRLRPSNLSTYFNVMPSGSETAFFIGSNSGNDYSGELPANGEYTIRVYLMRNAARRGESTKYTLEVSITGAAHDAAAGAARTSENQGASATERAAMGKFDATGRIPCAQAKGQPMGQCDFGVVRAVPGTGTVVVTLPDGRKRFIFFDKGRAVDADLSQADGDMTFRATKQSDLYMIQAGQERYEIPEAVIYGG